MDEIAVFIKAILDYMSSNNIQQKDVAELLCVGPGAVSNWISGKNGITKRNREKIMNLNPRYFISHPIEQSPKKPYLSKRELEQKVLDFDKENFELKKKIYELEQIIKGLQKEIKNLRNPAPASSLSESNKVLEKR